MIEAEAKTAKPSPPKEPATAPAKVPPQIPASAPTPSRGLTNGRGATNGTSLTRSQGAINGTGFGELAGGLTNGTGVSSSRVDRASPRGAFTRRWQFLAILVAVAVLIPTFIFIAGRTPEGLEIDGKFNDWSKAEMFGMYVPATGSGIAVEEWSVQSDGVSLYVYVNVEGTLMSTSDVDSFYFFVDADNSALTGYSVSQLGADYLLMLEGWESAIRATSVMRYDSTTDLLDWNSWTSCGSATCSMNSGQLEAMADLPVVLDSNARYLLLSQTSSPDKDFSVSYPVAETGGVLIARLEPGSSIDPSTGTVRALGDVVLGEIILSCEGVGGSVTSIDLAVVGASMVSEFSVIDMALGNDRVYDIVVDTSAASPADEVSVVLHESDFASTFSDVIVLEDSVHAYVGSAPASIKIDGAFGDWIGRLTADNDSDYVANPNINMTATAYAGTTSSASFYVSVEGEMFKGVYAPSSKANISGGGGGGGPVTPARKSGEDVLRIYIDSDMSNSTGLQVVRSSKMIGAEYLVDIRGHYGKIVSRSLMAYDGESWNPITAYISAANDQQRLELSVPTASIGGDASITTIIETTDWKDRSDWAWAASVPDPWVVNGAGVTYQSDTGVVWSYVGTPTLEPGDRIVDIAMTTDDGTVVLVTNTGRTYYWKFGTSTSFTAGETHPIDVATYSEAVAMAFFSKTGAWLLTKNGSYFYLMDAISPPANKEWTYQDVAATGVTDFTDINYEEGTMYALRSGANTTLSYSNNGNSFTSVTSPTGSTSNQSEFAYIPGGPGSSDDRVFVLCEDGSMRYSANGGSTWSALGDLPTPGVGNSSKYIGIGIDSTGYIWVVTTTGYVFRSTDTTTYANYTYMGQSPLTDVVAIIPLPAVVPEFQYTVIPMICVVLIVLSRRAVSKRRHRC